jgi:hypothetical protein
MEHRDLLPYMQASNISPYPDSDEFRPRPFDFFKIHFNIIPSTPFSSQQDNSLMFTIPNDLCISWLCAWNRQSLLRASRLWEKLWCFMGIHFVISTFLPLSVGSSVDDRNAVHTCPNLCMCEAVVFFQSKSVGVHTCTIDLNVAENVSI